MKPSTISAPPCSRPVYLTFDTGHMGVAPLVAQVLNRHQVKVTFFAANEKTKQGDGSLGDHWAPWWRARVAEGMAVREGAQVVAVHGARARVRTQYAVRGDRLTSRPVSAAAARRTSPARQS